MGKSKYLVTGANGFVAKALIKLLLQHDISVRGTVRDSKAVKVCDNIEICETGNICDFSRWSEILNGIDVIVHLAARVHVMKEVAKDPRKKFFDTNTAGTVKLAEAAAKSRVKKFVYVSSIKVNGEKTDGIPFTERSTPTPQDFYAHSKFEAEKEIFRIANNSQLDVTVLRPPIVYGAGVGGNFLKLMRLVKSGVPLPLASVRNLRSMIYIENFVDAIASLASQSKTAGQTYLVRDNEEISTPTLIRRLAIEMGRHHRLWPLPVRILRIAGHLIGKSAMVARLTDSLQVDCTKIKQDLGWNPPFTMKQGFRETVQWFLNNPVN